LQCIKALLGEGGFGTVLLVRASDPALAAPPLGPRFAMKVISKRRLRDGGDAFVAMALAERDVLATLPRHPCVLRLARAFQTPHALCVVLELCEAGDLEAQVTDRFVATRGGLPRERCAYYAASVVLALEHLHAHRVLYRDLKLENVLLHASGRVVLGDFGTCAALSYSSLFKGRDPDAPRHLDPPPARRGQTAASARARGPLARRRRRRRGGGQGGARGRRWREGCGRGGRAAADAAPRRRGRGSDGPRGDVLRHGDVHGARAAAAAGRNVM